MAESAANPAEVDWPRQVEQLKAEIDAQAFEAQRLEAWNATIKEDVSRLKQALDASVETCAKYAIELDRRQAIIDAARAALGG